MTTGFTGQVGKAIEYESRDFAAKPILRPGGRVCECTQCGTYFTGLAAFEKHFSGGTTCRTTDEMLEAGMVANLHGVWKCGNTAERATREII